MTQIDSLMVNDTLCQLRDADAQRKPLCGAGAPTAGVKGEVGQQYVDTETGALYQCTGVTETGCSWQRIARENCICDGAPAQDTAWSSEKAAQSFAGAITGKATGARIDMTDVSPLPHKVALQVSCPEEDAVALSGTKVYVCGKNQITEDFFSLDSWYAVPTGGYSKTLFLPAGKYTVWGDFSPSGTAAGHIQLIRDGSYYNYLFNNTAAETSRLLTFTVTEDTQYTIWVSSADAFAKMNALQVEAGSSKTSYDLPGKIYEAGSDGSVVGVMSRGTQLHCYTKTAGAVLEATYNRDTNAVIQQLTQAIISLGGNV